MSEGDLDHFFDAILDGALVLDPEFKVVRLNAAFARACRTLPEKVLGRRFFELYPSTNLPVFEDALRTGEPRRARAQPYEFPDDPARGITFWDWNLAPALGTDGKVKALLLCLHEVAEQRRTEESLRHASAQLRKLSNALVVAQESEQRRLAQVLHDEVGQELTGLKLMLENAMENAVGAERAAMQQALTAVHEVVNRIRHLSIDLRPPVLDDLGLVPALLWIVDRCKQISGLEVAFRHLGVERRLPKHIETAAFYIAKEALSNVAQHANCDHATVTLFCRSDALVLQIEDQGCGFDPELASERGTSMGLFSIKQRARALSGRVTLESAVGCGTIITADLPLGGGTA